MKEEERKEVRNYTRDICYYRKQREERERRKKRRNT
jgi:hypothetical protein